MSFALGMTSSTAMRLGKCLLARVAKGALDVGIDPVAVAATATRASVVTEVVASVAPVCDMLGYAVNANLVAMSTSRARVSGKRPGGGESH